MSKILLVEDDQFLIKMYQKKLLVAGFDVQIAHDGLEGLTLAKSFLPDLILMDVMMPKLNGLDALDKMKADPALKAIPVLIITNLSGTIDADTAIKKGAIGFLIKSDLTPTQIVDKVKEILNSPTKNSIS